LKFISHLCRSKINKTSSCCHLLHKPSGLDLHSLFT
jgi:hypothetical protein